MEIFTKEQMSEDINEIGSLVKQLLTESVLSEGISDWFTKIGSVFKKLIGKVVGYVSKVFNRMRASLTGKGMSYMQYETALMTIKILTMCKGTMDEVVAILNESSDLFQKGLTGIIDRFNDSLMLFKESYNEIRMNSSLDQKFYNPTDSQINLQRIKGEVEASTLIIQSLEKVHDRLETKFSIANDNVGKRAYLNAENFSRGVLSQAVAQLNLLTKVCNSINLTLGN